MSGINKLAGYNRFLFGLDCILTEVHYIQIQEKDNPQRFTVSNLRYLKGLLNKHIKE